MKQTQRKPWVRWMYLACSAIWLVNLVVRLSNYFGGWAGASPRSNWQTRGLTA